jgi:thiol-disulfide isomerase/thioredoxin
MNARFVRLLAIALVALAVLPRAGIAAEDPTVVVFYREGCEDCLRMEPVLRELEMQYPNLGFRFIEWADADASLMWALAARYGVLPSKFPVIFVGTTAIVGSSLSNELRLRSAVEACASSNCPSPLASLPASTIPWATILIVGLALLVLAALLLA